MEKQERHQLWRKIVDKYSQNPDLPNCLGGLSDDYYSFSQAPYSEDLINSMIEKHPGFKSLSEKMTDEFKVLIKRYEDHDKRKKEMEEERARMNDLIKEVIILPGNGLLISEFASVLVEILKRKNNLFFRPASKDIVEVTLIKTNDKDSASETELYVGFSEVTPNRFVTLVEQYVEPGYIQNDRKTNEPFFSKKSMSPQLAKTLLCCEILHKNLPHINRLFTYPIPIIKNGDITFPCKGYDPRFKSWTTYDSPQISDPKMTTEKAKSLIDDIFKEFCFKTDQDKSNAIAGLLTPFLRGLFPNFSTRTPVFFYLGNRERVGKDYLAGITGIIYEGAPLEEAPISTSEIVQGTNSNELRKKIFSAMISGRKRMHFSNNKGYINNAVFESIVTARKYSDRVLGRSEMLVFDNEIDFSLSGNSDIGYTPDFANRCRFVRLFLDIEDANARDFKNKELHTWVLKNRDNIFSALYSLVRNWINDGKPTGSLPFASFPEWAGICGGIMESAGYLNPCSSDINLFCVGGDSETQDMKDLFKLCYETYGTSPITRKQIIEILKNDEVDIFPDMDLNRKSDQTKFGMFLSKFCGRILGDIRLSVEDTDVRPARQKMTFSKEKNKSLDDFNTDKRQQPTEKEHNIKSGNLGNLGNLLPTPEILQKKIHINIGVYGRSPKVARLPPEILEKLERNFESIPEENIEDLEYELKDGSILKAIKPEEPENCAQTEQHITTQTAHNDTNNTKQHAKEITHMTYLDFMRDLPAVIFTLQECAGHGSKEAPLITDIIELMTKRGFYTEQQIELWVELGKKQGALFECPAGRINVI